MQAAQEVLHTIPSRFSTPVLTPNTDVATELLRAAIASGKHEITILTRSPPLSTPDQRPNVTYKQVDYHDLPALTTTLEGTHTVLSFLIAHLDTSNTAQKNLIHASIAAGVKRFAPSEWSIASNNGVPSYANKDLVAEYLASLKEKGELGDMEYCLFQPSVFMDYFAHPYPLSPGLGTWTFFLDFENRRAIVLDEGDDPIVVTAISDISQILGRALADSSPWPAVGGMRGCVTSINELLDIGKRVRGGDWKVEYVKSEDVEQGKLGTSWVPEFVHPVIPAEQREAFSKAFVVDFFKAVKNGSWMVGDEWNKRFPEYKMVSAEEYLEEAWKGRE